MIKAFVPGYAGAFVFYDGQAPSNTKFLKSVKSSPFGNNF
jgi:hypothetical protein